MIQSLHKIVDKLKSSYQSKLVLSTYFQGDPVHRRCHQMCSGQIPTIFLWKFDQPRAKGLINSLPLYFCIYIYIIYKNRLVLDF